jgi:predicted nucleotidyltransferase
MDGKPAFGWNSRRPDGSRPWSFCVKSLTLMTLPRDFQEFLQLLNAHGVKYVIVGGYAVNFHGYVRYTGDLDVFVALSSESALSLTRVFQEFGFNLPEVTPELFLNRGRIVRMGHEPMRLEILNEIDGVTFDECFANRVEVELSGHKINVIGLPQLLRNKQASGRLQDLADVEALTGPAKKTN